MIAVAAIALTRLWLIHAAVDFTGQKPFIKPTPTVSVKTISNEITYFHDNVGANSTSLRIKRKASGSCSLNSCCSRLVGCEPGNCYLDARTCTAFLNSGALSHLGRAVIGSAVLAASGYEVGNIRIKHLPDNPLRTLVTSLKPVKKYATMYSEFGTLSFWSDTGPTQTLVVSNAPHLVTDIFLEETIRKSFIITHRPLLPENGDFDKGLKCGPITILERAGKKPHFQTVWTTITPTTTTKTASDCTKYAGRNLYANVENFYTTPPRQTYHNGNYGQPQKNFKNGRPTFNGQQQSFYSSSPCYWCPRLYGSWSPSNPSYDGWPTLFKLGSTNGHDKSLPSDAWFSDVQADQVKDGQSACMAFIEHYAEAPLNSSQLLDFVNKTFYSTDELRTKYARGVEPSTFHCCHVEFADKLFPNKKEKFVQPVLPKDVSCRTLVDALHDRICGKNKVHASKAKYIN